MINRSLNKHRCNAFALPLRIGRDLGQACNCDDLFSLPDCPKLECDMPHDVW